MQYKLFHMSKENSYLASWIPVVSDSSFNLLICFFYHHHPHIFTHVQYWMYICNLIWFCWIYFFVIRKSFVYQYLLLLFYIGFCTFYVYMLRVLFPHFHNFCFYIRFTLNRLQTHKWLNFFKQQIECFLFFFPDSG